MLLFDLDAPWLRFLDLRQGQRQHAIAQLSADFALIDGARKTKASRIISDIVFRVEWPQIFVLRKVQAPVDVQDAFPNADIDVVLLDTRHFENDVQCIFVLEYIRRWQESPDRDGCLFLCLKLALLLNLQ